MNSTLSPEFCGAQKYVRPLRLMVLLLLASLLVGCSQDEVPQVGPRPANELSTVVEAYLQRYQPGPLPRLFQTTYLYDRNGELLAELYSEGRRSWATIDQISPYLLDATVATEDATFYINTGIDPIRIAGAAMQNMESGGIVSGASTITMQLARNLFMGFDDRYDQSLDRKIVEVGLARELTEVYTKDEVLEMYLNTVNYGNLAYGPEAAARTYFNKSAADLTLAEATLLAGLPQQPAFLNPFFNFEAARDRQRIVLNLMARHGYLSQEEADAVYAEPILLNPDPTPPEIRAPHFVNYLVGELDARLGSGFVRRGGMHIYTTLDLKVQEVAQEIVTRRVREFQATYDMNNGALVAMKPGTAEILAMVGSADYFNNAIDGQVNVAIRPRQPGSAIKPLLFATALNDNLISPATVIWDTPVTYRVPAQPDYEPRNFDRRFHGPVTARVALANSYNIPAVKLLDQVSVERMLESSQAMGIRSFLRGADWYGLSLTLGGSEVTLLDLTNTYHTMANAGVAMPARPILAMADTNGRSMMENMNYGQGTQAISSAAAFLITDIMSDNNARIPMFGVNNRLTLSRPVAAKTGTTDDNRDNWTMGYTRYLITGVWVGNTQGKPMRTNATGASAAAPIWNEFMETMISDPDLRARIGAPDDPEQWGFTPPPDVELHNECPVGLVCRNGGGEYFAKDWLQFAAYSGGPLSDSVVRAPSLSVYRNGQLIGYCLEDRGVVRTLVRLPARFGLPSAIELATVESDSVGDRQASIAGSLIFADHNRLNNLQEPLLVDLAINSRNLSDEMQNDRRRAMSYSGQVRGQVSLGPCDEVQSWLGAVTIARNELGSSEAMVRIPPMSAPEPVALAETSEPTVDPDGSLEAAETPEPIGTPEPVETPEPIETPEFVETEEEEQPIPVVVEERPTPVPVGRNRYQVSNLYHGNDCPGSYIMGRIINWEGGPVAGVRVSMVDGWGNYYESMSKSGASDFGHFDFPLYSGTPQDLKLTVLDGNGNPISPTFVIPHNQSPTSSYPCHFVTFQGG
ncbi:MAG: transglycosylase domain-containing protein [Caldilineaceae bacterium]|nr:transglycosylase domain-containing protein [Caldilineaceae bacterium]